MICDFLFIDDLELNASTQSNMQGSKDLFFKVCKDFGLTISTKKTCTKSYFCLATNSPKICTNQHLQCPILNLTLPSTARD